jgi:hypothetical protein
MRCGYFVCFGVFCIRNFEISSDESLIHVVMCSYIVYFLNIVSCHLYKGLCIGNIKSYLNQFLNIFLEFQEISRNFLESPIFSH